MITSDRIKTIARECGADLCGIASVDRFVGAPSGFHPRDIYDSTETEISFALRIPDFAFASGTRVPYTFTTSEALKEISRMTYRLGQELERDGITAVPIPSEPYEFWDSKTMTGKGILSLRHAAALAGIGVITRNHLLTNELYGNRIVLGALLTNISVTPDSISTEPQCPISCNLCRDMCPVNAIRDDGVIQKLCRTNAEGFNEKGYYLYRCRLCREKCPLSKGKNAEPAGAGDALQRA